MADPLWDVEFSDEVNAARDKYRNQLRLKVFLSGIVRENSRARAEIAEDEQDEFEAFLQSLSKQGSKHRDPNKLPTARNDAGNVIPDCFCFSDDIWTAYIYRDYQKDGPCVSRVILHFEESDRFTALKGLMLTRG